MTIRIKNNQRKKRLATAALRTKLKKLLLSIDLPDAEFGILFIGDRAMRTLNRRYRARDATTDVLSFSLREGGFAHIQPHILGDIVVSVPRAARQAAGAGHSLDREVERLVVHGLVHLLGYDHKRGPREARRMERKEQELLAVLAT